MTFKEGQPIYVQIAERLCDEVLSGTYGAGQRVPSVREYSVLLEVNVNTTVKAYDYLAQRGVIYNRRGMGYYVADDAATRIRDERRRAFVGEELPEKDPLPGWLPAVGGALALAAAAVVIWQVWRRKQAAAHSAPAACWTWADEAEEDLPAGGEE